MRGAYYNEFDPNAAAWLRELIWGGHIAPGDVDERSISDVRPDDLTGYAQCHFFAGIGVWSYALRRAGWPDDRPVWTGSCPCQPFSSAGKRKGTADERHLWPHWHWLMAQCLPTVVFGEQVASKDGRAWFDTVQADMEALGFAVGAADLCAAGVGAPHIRQRLWFYGTRALAHADSTRRGQAGRNATGHREADAGRAGNRSGDAGAHDIQRGVVGLAHATGQRRRKAGGGVGDRPEEWQSGDGPACGLAHTTGDGRLERGSEPNRRSADTTGASEWLADAERHGLDRAGDIGATRGNELSDGSASEWSNPTNGYWRDPDWLGCRDGKWRPVEPGTFPLAHGSPARVGRLRGYGNAIVAPVAQAFIEASQGWD